MNEFEKQLKWRLDAFHDGILAKTDIISDMAGVVRKQLKDARVDENQFWIDKIIRQGAKLAEDDTIFVNEFEIRIKELKEK